MTKPDNDSLIDAAEVCEDYADYLRETEPDATRSIDLFEDAANELRCGADDSLDDDRLKGYENEDGPITGGDGD